MFREAGLTMPPPAPVSHAPPEPGPGGPASGPRGCGVVGVSVICGAAFAWPSPNSCLSLAAATAGFEGIIWPLGVPDCTPPDMVVPAGEGGVAPGNCIGGPGACPPLKRLP